METEFGERNDEICCPNCLAKIKKYKPPSAGQFSICPCCGKMIEVAEQLTIDGLRKLKEMKQKGEPLPPEWEEAAQNWRIIKFRNNEKMKNELAQAEAQYNEGVSIIEFLKK